MTKAPFMFYTLHRAAVVFLWWQQDQEEQVGYLWDRFMNCATPKLPSIGLWPDLRTLKIRHRAPPRRHRNGYQS
jgi:hypothetical protein